MIEGTAPQLKKEVEKAVTPIFAGFLSELLDRSGLGVTETLETRFRDHTRQLLEKCRSEMIGRYGKRCNVPAEFRHERLQRFAGRPILDACRESLVDRSKQTLFLLRFVLSGNGTSDEAISAWVTNELVKPMEESLHRIVEHYLTEDAESATDEYDRLELAEQEAVFRLEECRSVDLVGRYDGSNSRD
jgi:hypothetical protein